MEDSIIMTFSGNPPPLSMLEQRLHELLQSRSQNLTPISTVDLRPFNEHSIPTSTCDSIQNYTTCETNIPKNEINTFCELFSENRKKFNEIGAIMGNINDRKDSVMSSQKLVKEHLYKIAQTQDIQHIIQSIDELVTQVIIEQNNKAETYKSIYEELTNFMSDSFALFNTIKSADTHNTPIAESKDIMMCPVCYEDVVDHVVTPCGHTLCKKCTKKVSKHTCIVCRKSIMNIIPFYLSMGGSAI